MTLPPFQSSCMAWGKEELLLLLVPPQSRWGVGNLYSTQSLPPSLSFDSGNGYTDHGGASVPPPHCRSPERSLHPTWRWQLLTVATQQPQSPFITDLPSGLPCWSLLHEPTQKDVLSLVHLLVLCLAQSAVEHVHR